MFVFPSFMYKIKTDMNYPCLVQNKRNVILKTKTIPTMLVYSFINAFTKWKQKRIVYAYGMNIFYAV